MKPENIVGHIKQEVKLEDQESGIIGESIDLVVGEAYESIGTGLEGILTLADIESDIYEISIAKDVTFRKQCIVSGVASSYLWRGNLAELVDGWIYVGPSIQGYEEIVEKGCCKLPSCSKLDTAVEMISYGLEWTSDVFPVGKEVHEEIKGLMIETLAHSLACFITQNLTHDSTPTSEIVDLIKDFPSDEELKTRILKYIAD